MKGSQVIERELFDSSSLFDFFVSSSTVLSITWEPFILNHTLPFNSIQRLFVNGGPSIGLRLQEIREA